MSRYLFVMWEGGGNVPAQLSLARRLVARGHEVRVLGDPVIEPQVVRAGASFRPFERAPRHNTRDVETDTVRDFEGKTPIAQFKRIATHVFFGPAERYALDLLDAASAYEPDALAVDCLLFGALVGAEKTGLPTAALFHTIYMGAKDGIPPPGMGFRPARSWPARLLHAALRKLVVRSFDFGTPLLNGARANLGMPLLRHALDQLDRATVSLVMTNRTFDFHAAELGPNVKYVGAQLDDPSWAQTSWTPPWSPADEDRPLVLVSLGSTFQGQEHALRRIMRALEFLPVRGLVTLGGQYAPRDFEAPPNVHVVAAAPHQAILPRTSVAVVHGGHGSVMKALAHGVPVLCVPFGRDQADVAARAVAAGAGLVASRGADAIRFRRQLRRLLDEATFREGAARMAALIAADTAADRGVAELEALVPARQVVLSLAT